MKRRHSIETAKVVYYKTTMPTIDTDWADFLKAAKRKVEIAHYHAHRLDEVLAAEAGATGEMPAIPVQAHFEGVVISIMAAVDQVAQATNSALRLSLSTNSLVTESFTQLGQSIPPLADWFDEPFGRDLRRLRTRMIHYAYRKSREGLVWTVESVDTNYSGSRELRAYAGSAAEYACRLLNFIPDIHQYLARCVEIYSSETREGAH